MININGFAQISRVILFKVYISFPYVRWRKFRSKSHTFHGRKIVMQRCSPKYVFITEHLSAHLNSYISEYSRKANNLSRDHTLVKIIAKLWDALYSFNYQPVSSGSFARHSRFLPILLVHLVSPDTCQLSSFLCVSLSFFLSSFSLSSARYSLLRASLFFTGRFWISTPVLIIRPANKHCRRHWSDTLSGPTMINGTIKFTWKYRRIRSRAYGVYNCYFIPVFFFPRKISEKTCIGRQVINFHQPRRRSTRIEGHCRISWKYSW